MKLYSFPTSSASYRVRIALNLKGIPYETVTINIPRSEQTGEPYRQINPLGRVPVLELDDGTRLFQSLAIIDYLERTYPAPALFPGDPVLRAQAMATALTVVADIHPLNNVGVLAYLRDTLGIDQAERDGWYAHWLRNGLAAINDMIEGPDFCFAGQATVADVCLVPQVFNARRFNVDIRDLKKVVAVDEHARRIPAFAAAAPDREPQAAPA